MVSITVLLLTFSGKNNKAKHISNTWHHASRKTLQIFQQNLKICFRYNYYAFLLFRKDHFETHTHTL